MTRSDTTMIRLARLVRTRLDEARSDRERGMAMLIVLMFMILLLGMSLSIVSTIRAQPTSVFTSERSTKTVYAAQAGMQAALGQLRSIPLGTGYGDRTKLPCSISGTVDGGSTSASYTATLRYFLLNPTGHTTDSTWLTANSLTCTPGSGTAVTPAYSLVESTGNAAHIDGLPDGTVRRKVQAVYVFNLTNINIPGGRILDLSQTYCLQAGTATAGANVTFQTTATCDSAGTALTSWIYDTDWKLKLASTLTTTPLCITDPTGAADPRAATLQPCLTGAASWTQLWSWTGDYSWRGQQNPIANGPSSTCLSAMTTPIASNVKLAVKSTTCNQSFFPTSAVGAGAASKATNQMVNYQEFGRCADVTGENINAAFMIAYPCKQDPTGTGNQIRWNHKWYYNDPSTGQTTNGPQHIVVTNYDGTNYCLTTPATGVSPAYVTFTLCDATNTNQYQNWTRVGDTGDYNSSYLFTDRYNRCLGVNPSDTFNGWSKMVVAACNGSLAQKWNSPPATNQSTFGYYKEITP